MRYLTYIGISLLFLLTAGPGQAEDAQPPAEKTTESHPPKPVRRLKGEFKGHPITPPPDAENGAQPAGPKSSAAKPSGDKKPAKKPEEKAAEKPLVIDNALVGAGTRRPAEKKEPPAQSSAPAPPPTAVTPVVPVDLNGNGEAYWRAKAKQLRDALAQAQQALEAARQEEKREENDFYAWDDGQYRDNVIKPAWDRSREETARAEQALTAAQKAVDDLEDDARKAGAYPGWIRE